MMRRDAPFPVGITPSGPYPSGTKRTSFNRWWITILWDEDGDVSLFAWKGYPVRTDEAAFQFVGKGSERVEVYIHTHGLCKWFYK